MAGAESTGEENERGKFGEDESEIIKGDGQPEKLHLLG